MRKRPNITEQTKENIKQAFWQLYNQKPIQHITVREITELAGYNRSTFYTYFKDVRDVLEQAEREILELVNNVDEHSIVDVADVSDMVNIMKPFINFCKENYDCLKLLIGSQGDPKFINELYSITRQKNAKIFASKINPESRYFNYIVDYAMITWSVFIMRWLEDDNSLTIDELANFIYDITVKAVIPLFIEKYSD